MASVDLFFAHVMVATPAPRNPPVRIVETTSGGKLVVHRPNNGNLPFVGIPIPDYFFPWQRIDQDGNLIEDDSPGRGRLSHPNEQLGGVQDVLDSSSGLTSYCSEYWYGSLWRQVRRRRRRPSTMLAAWTSEAMRRLREADAGEGEGVLEANEEISAVEAVEAAARAGDAGMVGFACTKRSWNQISRVFHAIMDGGYASFMMLPRAVTDVIGEYEDGDLNSFMILAIIKNDAGEVVGRLELIKSSDNGAYLVNEDSVNSLITLFESNSAPKVVFVGLIDGQANVLSVVYLPNEDKV
ncbi:uncharacterized protein LTHEOB_9921 [Lasiodiplodia theobromae]|uniref:uncharacterized protein n=1 Tax=Lasiodiplodia theobromae TaxID=45133 RepID=UPI0015C30F14|nr:uncharacterized protein LTHEOB_9921 [Lasiodiplodia theobromae]KAF4539803.1 hypothetical protein LTHEOB_9921 [Lasiodiplodia theobromae]